MKEIFKEYINKDVTTLSEYKQLLKNQDKQNFLTMFCLLSKILEEECLLNKSYTIRELANDNYLNEQYTYRILRFRFANKYVQNMVIEDKISGDKVSRILSGRRSRKEQSKVVKYVIDNKLTAREIDKYLVVMNKNSVKELRKTKTKVNLTRDFFLYVDKLIAILPTLSKAKLQIRIKVEIIRKLNELKEEMKKSKIDF